MTPSRATTRRRIAHLAAVVCLFILPAGCARPLANESTLRDPFGDLTSELEPPVVERGRSDAFGITPEGRKIEANLGIR